MHTYPYQLSGQSLAGETGERLEAESDAVERLRAQMNMIELGEEDLVILRSIQPLVLRFIDEIVDSFYQSVLSVDALKTIITDHSTVERLRTTLREHLIEMFSGRIDAQFIQKRLRIAEVHERIGLEPRWYMGAFQNLQNAFLNLLHQYIEDQNESFVISKSVTKLLNLEQQLVLEAYEKKAKEKIQYMAFHDELTGLPNRRLLHDVLQRTIDEHEQEECSFAVMFLDIDRFKMINDSLGHGYGDQFLKMVSERLQMATEGYQTLIARMGGDEFTVICFHRTEQEPVELANRIIETIRTPYQLNGNEFYVTTSIGIAVYPEHGRDSSELLKKADTAMYEVKKNGKNAYLYYSEKFDEKVTDKLALESDLRKAIEKNELVVYYQPQVTLADHQLIGVEALVRWNHPEKGMISPGVFIPIAEETGLITEIGEWVLQEACRQMKAWHDAGGPRIRVSVNLSTQQFHQANLSERIRQLLNETGLDAQYLELEITESMMMDVGRSTAILHELTKLGVYISMDDFGTGYSSLSYLKLFPIRKLKIDQSFMKEVATNPNDKAIVATIISMAHHLNMSVIAEGVEDEEQIAYLAEHGCDDMQGYFYSPPLPAAEMEKKILNR